MARRWQDRFMQGLAICGLLAAVLAWAAICGAGDRVRVRWVADGDTVVLADGRHIRYPQINCPETAHADRPAEPFADAARDLNRRMVAAQNVRLAPADPPKDRYGRYLADLVLEDGTSVSRALLAAGMAHVLPVAPHGSENAALLEIQRRAMDQGKGIWARLDRRPVLLLGNRRSKRFHRVDSICAKKIGKHHRVAFPDYKEAFYAGYAPCRRCFQRLETLLTPAAF